MVKKQLILFAPGVDIHSTVPDLNNTKMPVEQVWQLQL
jgi:hypothetical protein